MRERLRWRWSSDKNWFVEIEKLRPRYWDWDWFGGSRYSIIVLISFKLNICFVFIVERSGIKTYISRMWFSLVELCGDIFSSQEATQEVALEKRRPSWSRNPSPSRCKSVYLGLNLSISLCKSIFILVSLSNLVSFSTQFLSQNDSLTLSQIDQLSQNLHS